MANLNPTQTLDQNIASLIAVVNQLEVEAGVVSFNGRAGAVAPTTGDYTVAQVTGAAPLASPTFTGHPVGVTETPLTNSTRLASTAYADLAVTAGQVLPKEVDSADGAIALKNGGVFITKGSAAALTLALPTAGTDDNKTLQIVATTAFAHTVTTPSNGLNGGKHILTFANVGDSAILKAYNAVWYVVYSAAALS